MIGGVNTCVQGVLNLGATNDLLQDKKQDGDYDYEELVEEKCLQTSSNIPRFLLRQTCPFGSDTVKNIPPSQIVFEQNALDCM